MLQNSIFSRSNASAAGLSIDFLRKSRWNCFVIACMQDGLDMKDAKGIYNAFQGKNKNQQQQQVLHSFGRTQCSPGPSVLPAAEQFASYVSTTLQTRSPCSLRTSVSGKRRFEFRGGRRSSWVLSGCHQSQMLISPQL